MPAPTAEKLDHILDIDAEARRRAERLVQTRGRVAAHKP
jgi:hypothetical protein